MRQTNGLKFAVLALVAYNPDGVHGYALKRQCDRVLGHFWQLNFPEIYRVLDQLAAEQWIEAAREEPGSSRKVFRITQQGRDGLDTFLVDPPPDLPRPLRQELAVKLLFAHAERLPQLFASIKSQRETYMEQLHLLAVQRRKLQRLPVDPFVVNLLIDGAEGTVRAELAWLEHVSMKLTERFGASVA